LRKQAVIAGIARMVRKMHQAGVQHRSLYPKHLFVNENNGVVDVAIIDFEKSRITPWIALLKLSDLITLNYRTHSVSRTQRLYFFRQYLGVSRLNGWQKRVCCYIYQQSLKKSSVK
jgi:tRNA A-37 threonylcarbamoyl transferase component Bud32